MTGANSTIKFATSLAQEVCEAVSRGPRRSDDRGFKVYGPLAGRRSHVVVVLADEGVDPLSIPRLGYRFPLPAGVGKGFLADIEEFPISIP